MKQLLLIRHAKSSWNQPELPDFERPLNKRGKKSAVRMGQLLFSENMIPDMILSSTARRAVQTTEILAEISGFDGEIIYNHNLYQGWPDDYFRALGNISDQANSVAVIGHNPAIEELLNLLTDENPRMPTAALAYLKVPITNWKQLTDETEGELIGIWYPRDLLD